MAIQIGFGWTFAEGYEFIVGSRSFRGEYPSDESGLRPTTSLTTRLSDVVELPGERFTYIRLGEAGWVYDVELIAIEERSTHPRPRCADGNLEMPNDQFGGNNGYVDFQDHVRKRDKEGDGALREWVDYVEANHRDYYNEFDTSGINKKLSNMDDFDGDR